MNQAIFNALICGFYLGVGAGWWFNRKPAKIEVELVVDDALLKRMDAQVVNTWLANKGLVWQPKGAVFDASKDVKK